MKLIKNRAVFAGLALIIAAHANAGKLYKWVDANGNISYQDQPPPKNAKILSEKETSGKKAEPKREQPKVIVYSVDDCELCDRLISVLRKDKVAHIVLPLADDREAQSRILENAGSIIAPSIFIGDTLVQGGSEENLREQLQQASLEIESAE